ncbi:unnamed protein product [Heterosigma akashiwo]|mmetsp:Transcript_22275/g.38856  ORF Transcript_22275/g.38856 Transcript_22275/m.38856 type:complete len:379 (-) Transcript_22275:120-1256(-)
MAHRPTVSVFSSENPSETEGSVTLPVVMTAPIRPDIVQFVHTNMNKNKRQAYAVKEMAGHQTSAESWGTGRAVSRIPRVQGGGTQRAGQGAFGNMCRSGRMFGPTKQWRRWHRKINVNQKRYALASAVAASAVPALVMARGHKVDQVPELPLVVCADAEGIQKTKKAVALLEAVGAGPDLAKVKASRTLRAGKGKLRGRRFTSRKGPLVIYDGASGCEKAFRNIPGVELCRVDALNLLQLAPGGHMGRFCVWTKPALEKLDALYGTYVAGGAKAGYTLPRNIMANGDLSRLINSDEIQSIVKPKAEGQKAVPRKKNPLKNLGALAKLNPYAVAARRAEYRAQAARAAGKAAAVAKARGTGAAKRAFYEKANLDGPVKF